MIFHDLKNSTRAFIVIVLGTPVLFLCLHSSNFIRVPHRSIFLENHATEEVVQVEPTCSPSRDVFIFEDHKTGNQTFFNIFMRLADEKNLTVAVSRDPGNSLEYSDMLNTENLPDYSIINRHVQVLAIHTRLDIKSAKRLMAPQAKFIAILKDPVYSWPSGFSYFNSPALNRMPLEKFLNDAIDSMKKRKFPPWFSSNFLYFDLGFDETLIDTLAAQAQAAIEMLEENFELVMIAELMDESLILMLHALCWELEDVVSFRQNESYPTIHPEGLDSELISKVAQLNDIDVRIYHHFTEKLRNKVEEFGLERMQMEVKMLRLKRDNWLRSCLSGYRHGFQAEICQRLTRTDTDYVYYFREQYKIEFGQNPLGEGQIR